MTHEEEQRGELLYADVVRAASPEKVVKSASDHHLYCLAGYLWHVLATFQGVPADIGAIVMGEIAVRFLRHHEMRAGAVGEGQS